MDSARESEYVTSSVESSICRKTADSAAGTENGKMVLLLVETAAGFALFKVLKEKKLKETKVSTHSVRPDLLASQP